MPHPLPSFSAPNVFAVHEDRRVWCGVTSVASCSSTRSGSGRQAVHLSHFSKAASVPHLPSPVSTPLWWHDSFRARSRQFPDAKQATESSGCFLMESCQNENGNPLWMQLSHFPLPTVYAGTGRCCIADAFGASGEQGLRTSRVEPCGNQTGSLAIG